MGDSQYCVVDLIFNTLSPKCSPACIRPAVRRRCTQPCLLLRHWRAVFIVLLLTFSRCTLPRVSYLQIFIVILRSSIAVIATKIIIIPQVFAACPELYILSRLETNVPCASNTVLNCDDALNGFFYFKKASIDSTPQNCSSNC